jgi:sulfonate transport system permease protein
VSPRTLTITQAVPATGLATPFEARTLSWRRLGWLVLPAAAPLAILLAWSAAVQLELVSRQVLVPPEKVLATFLHLLSTGELAMHVGKSMTRLALGFAAGASSGLALGVAMGASPRVEEAVAPLFRVTRQIPSIALLPALILILGVGESFKIVVVAKASFFPVALAAFEGVRQIPRPYLDVAAVHRLPARVLLTRLLIPATVPHVVAGVRTSLGRSWMILVASELVAADSGLGQMMEMGRQMFRIDVVMVGVFVTGVVGLALDGGVRLLERRLGRWKRS